MDRLKVTGHDEARSRMGSRFGRVRSLTLEPKGVRGRDGTRLTLGAARSSPRGCPSFVQALVLAAVLLYLSPWLLLGAVPVSVWAYGKAQR